MSTDSYLLAGKDKELERLQRGSRMLEPAGRRLLAEIGDGQGARALDVGCGALGWVRPLSEWVGPDGQVIGTDIQDDMLTAAQQFVTTEGLGNVTLVNDDLFASHHLPPAPAFDRLKPLVIEAFRRAGGDPEAAATQLELFRSAGIEANVRAEIRPLSLGDPALQEPLQYLSALDGLLRSLVDPEELERLRAEAERELQDPAAGDSTSHWCRSGASVGPRTSAWRERAERGRPATPGWPTSQARPGSRSP